ncbi:MAG: TrbC/VirB2 family protein [Candidatus Pacebacteria bacterium]|nr:TrbC/VirB2 family protein [Candidatus Paceibacterota bacterium]
MFRQFKQFWNKGGLLPFSVLTAILLLPSVAFAKGIVPCGGAGESACNLCYFETMVNNFLNFLLFELTLPVSVLAFIVAGFYFMTSGGNPGTKEKGKEIFKNTAIGLIIAFSAYSIVNSILGVLLTGEFKVWQKFPACELVEMKSAPEVSAPLFEETPSSGNSNANASAELAVFQSCFESRLSGVRITSVADNNIVSGTCNYTSPGESFNDSQNCQHTQYSCHYGGRNCSSKGSYALDVGTNLSFDQVKKAAGECNIEAKCLNEGNHYHVSIGAAYGCGCDEGLSSCR